MAVTRSAPSSCERAYSVLTIKAIDEELRQISGIATTPEVDRMGDIVESQGITFKNPMPLLLYHDSEKPVGTVTFDPPTKKGISFTAKIARILDPGAVRDRVDEAWTSVKSGLIKGVSIGFRPIEYAFMESGGLHFLQSEVLELSLVAIPANASAVIQTLKQYDVDRSAASGTTADPVRTTPGVSGAMRSVSLRASTGMPKPISDQIRDLEATRAAKAAALETIQTKATDEGRTKDPQEKEQFDTLKAEIKGLDEELADLAEMEAIQKAAAKPVSGRTDEPIADGGRQPRIIVAERKLPPGLGYARLVACKAHAAVEMRNGNFVTPLQVARERYPSDSALQAIFSKAAVAGGTTSGSHAYDDLVPYQVLQSDFIDYLRPKTIVGQFGRNGIPSLRTVPFNIRVGGFSAGTTGYWKGEAKPIPVSKATSENVTLTWAFVAGLTLVSQELVRHSTPSAEMQLRDDLAGAVTARMDIDFVDPTKAAVANTSPASITHGIAATAASGTAATNVRHDLAALLALFAGNNLGRSNLVLIMSDTMAGNIAMMVNTLGNNDFPELAYDANPPRLRGIPVIISEHLTGVGSPSTQTIVLVKADEVFLADDGNVTVDASMEASIEMLDGSLQQDGTNGTGASLLNLWQTGMVALRAQREINWTLRRSTAVQYISPAAYVPPTS